MHCLSSRNSQPKSLTKSQIMTAYKAELREYRLLQEELGPWTQAFKAQHGRKPTLADVERTGDLNKQTGRLTLLGTLRRALTGMWIATLTRPLFRTLIGIMTLIMTLGGRLRLTWAMTKTCCSFSDFPMHCCMGIGLFMLCCDYSWLAFAVLVAAYIAHVLAGSWA